MVIAPSSYSAIAVGVAAGAATYLGGVATFRLARNTSLILGVAAGAVIGVALFDLLTEAITLGSAHYGVAPLFACVALGMIACIVIDRGLAGLPARFADARRHLGPAFLTLHSLMDGLGIGMTFHLSSAAGIMMAIGVLAHDLADGMNTVSLGLSTNKPPVAHRWLVANSLAPVGGVIVGLWIDIGNTALAPMLALFGGVFLHIGASQLIPRALAPDNQPSAAIAIAAGMVLIYMVLDIARQ